MPGVPTVEPTEPPPSTPPQEPNLTTILIVLAIVALAAVAILFLRKNDEPRIGASEPPPALPSTERKLTPSAKPVSAPPEAAATKPTEQPKRAKSPEKAPAAEEKPQPKPSAPPAAVERPAVEAASEGEAGEAREPAAVSPKRGKRSSATAAPRDVAGLRKGLAKARESEGFFGRLRALFSGKKEIDPALLDEIEEVLLTSDVGVQTTNALVESLKSQLAKNELADESRVWGALRERAVEILDLGGGGLALESSPTVVMVVGVNGVGKTTTIGKLAARLTQQGKKVVLAAGDTFRAAAVEQLIVWGKRAGCEVVTGAEGANAGAVIFDAIQKAKDSGADVVLADTAGRLHTKSNLMEELKKIHRTMGKALDGAPHETLLVLDATNGQNATQQAALFKEALPLSGIVLTKLDGTAKGGVILSICAEHEVPVRYIGIGERADDLRDFVADEFVEALLGTSSEGADKAA